MLICVDDFFLIYIIHIYVFFFLNLSPYLSISMAEMAKIMANAMQFMQLMLFPFKNEV